MIKVQGIDKSKFRDFIDIDIDIKTLNEFKNDKISALLGADLVGSKGELSRYRYKIGETYNLADFKGVSIKFIGTYTSKDSSYNNVILVGSDYLQELDNAIGEASHLFVLIDNVENASKVINGIDTMPLPFKTETKEAKSFIAAAKKELEDIINFQRLIMIITLTIILIGVANTISMATRDRVRELGVLRSIGFQRYKIVVLILLEGVFVSFFGGLIGATVATAYFKLNKLQDAVLSISVDLSVSPFVFTLAICFPIVLGFIGGLPTAISASRNSIPDSLRNPG